MTKLNIFITGSNVSLGKSLIKVFKSDEYQLILHSRKKSKRPNIINEEINYDYIYGDFSKQNDLNSILNNIKKKRIDILINNAGIHNFDNLKNLNIKKLREIFEINFFSCAAISQVIFNKMLKRNKGIIININSIAGKVSNGNELSYCASKAALRSLSESLQINSIGSNIEIINIYPGAFKSKITKSRDNYSQLMDPDEISQMIYDLCKQRKTLKVSEISIFRK